MEPSPKPTREKIVIAALGVEGQVRDVAETELSEEAKDAGFLKKVFKHKIFREYFRQKKINAARKSIVQKGNFYHGSGEKGGSGTWAKSERLKESVIDQFSDEYDDALHEEAGEYRNVLGDEGRAGEVKAKLQELLKEFVMVPEMTQGYKEEFERRKNEILNEYAGVSSGLEEAKLQAELKGYEEQLANKEITDAAYRDYSSQIHKRIERLHRENAEPARIYADNLLEVAEQFRAAGDHEDAITELIEGTEIIIGQAKAGARTEAEYNSYDRLFDKLRASPLKPFLNMPVVAAGAALAYSVGSVVAKGKIRAAAALGAGIFGGAVGGALFIPVGALLGSATAGAFIGRSVEKQRLLEQRTQHLRDIAKGKAFDKNAAERREMHKYSYETRDVQDLIAGLWGELYTQTDENTYEPKPLDEVDTKRLFETLAATDAYILASDRHGVDLISYTEEASITKERHELDMLRREAKKLFGEEELSELESARAKLVRELMHGKEGSLGVEQKDRLFNKMRDNAGWKAAARGLAFGGAFGLVAQEVGAVATDGLNHLGVGIDRGDTVLRSLFREATPGTPSSVHVDNILLPEGKTSLLEQGDSKYFLPEGTGLQEQKDGTFNFTYKGEALAKHLEFKSDGSLTKESQRILKEHGIISHTKDFKITDAPVTKNVEYLSKEYAAKHSDLFKQIHRVGWYDNDTPMPVVDGNEAKLHWGGINGTGIDKDGNIVYSLRRMTSDGSFAKGLSADVKKLFGTKEIKMMFSLSRDSQTFVMEADVDANGNAIINQNSPLARMFFKKTPDGVEFLGKYAEVAQVVGKEGDVAQVRILATDVGKGIEKLPDTEVSEPRFHYGHTTKFTVSVPQKTIIPGTPGIPLPPIDIPMALPWWGRRELEPGKQHWFYAKKSVPPAVGAGPGEKEEEEDAEEDEDLEADKETKASPKKGASKPVSKEKEAAEKKKRRTRKEKVLAYEKAVDARFLRFVEKDSLGFEPVPGRSFRLKDSRSKEKIGEFVICRDFLLADTPHGKMYAAFKKGTRDFFIAQEASRGGEKIESYLLKKGFADQNVRLPIKTLENGAKTIRIYEGRGVELEEYLKIHRLSMRESLSLMIRTSKSVEGLHKAGIANLNLGPSNIIVGGGKAGDAGFRIANLDTASVERLRTGKFTQKEIGGDGHVRAPELFELKARFDRTVDVYALGANLYRLVEGTWPYEESDPVKLKELHETGAPVFDAATPDVIQEIILKAMDPEPLKRYQSATELTDALMKAYKKVPATVPLPGPVPRPTPPPAPVPPPPAPSPAPTPVPSSPEPLPPSVSSEGEGLEEVIGNLPSSEDDSSFAPPSLDESSPEDEDEGVVFEEGDADEIDWKADQSVLETAKEDPLLPEEDEIIEHLFGYEDITISDKERERLSDDANRQGKAEKYAHALREAFIRYGTEYVDQVANEIKESAIDFLDSAGINYSKYTNSRSWVLWDMARQYHYLLNPRQAPRRYRIADPLTDQVRYQEIIDRQIGWEVYNTPNKLPLLNRIQDPGLREEIEGLLGKRTRGISAPQAALLGRKIQEAVTLR